MTDPDGAQVPGLTISASGPEHPDRAHRQQRLRALRRSDARRYTVTLTDPGYVDSERQQHPHRDGDGRRRPVRRSPGTSSPWACRARSRPRSPLGGDCSARRRPTGCRGAAPADRQPDERSRRPPAPRDPSQRRRAPSTEVAVPVLHRPDRGYTNNYTVWGGRCAEQQPPTPTQVSVSPGPAASRHRCSSLSGPQRVTYKSAASRRRAVAT